MGRPLIDLTGKSFNRLTVIKILEKHTCGSYYYKCECSCGNIVKVISNNIKSGKIKSCGCLKRELNIKNNTKHGENGTKLHDVWCGLKQRCYDKITIIIIDMVLEELKYAVNGKIHLKILKTM